jgi:aryl-alcohol dehydrogenase-like predicted oxidoreductase
MDYRYLGKTGLRVSELWLGGLTFGREIDRVASHQILDRFAEAGGTTIDTANAYFPPTQGASERIIGTWLKDRRRDRFVIATKVYFPMGDGSNDMGLSRKHILSAIEGSLRRLQTDYVDLYQVHCWDRTIPLAETLGTLNDLVRQGKARYVGASNFTGAQLQRAIGTSRRRGWEQLRSVQARYNLLCRSTEWEVIPVCESEGLGCVCWSPLQGGWLTGKYREDMEEPPSDSRAGQSEGKAWGAGWDELGNKRTWRVVDELVQVARELGRSPAQVAIRWVAQRPGVTAPILGVRTLEQLEANLAVAEFSLSDDQMEQLNGVSAVALPYPHDYIADVERRYNR